MSLLVSALMFTWLHKCSWGNLMWTPHRPCSIPSMLMNSAAYFWNIVWKQLLKIIIVFVIKEKQICLFNSEKSALIIQRINKAILSAFSPFFFLRFYFIFFQVSLREKWPPEIITDSHYLNGEQISAFLLSLVASYTHPCHHSSWDCYSYSVCCEKVLFNREWPLQGYSEEIYHCALCLLCKESRHAPVRFMFCWT